MDLKLSVHDVLLHLDLSCSIAANSFEVDAQYMFFYANVFGHSFVSIFLYKYTLTLVPECAKV